MKEKHPELVAPLASLGFTDGLQDFSSWYTAALLACPWNLRESFYEIRDRIHSKDLVDLLDQAFEQTIVCRIE